MHNIGHIDTHCDAQHWSHRHSLCQACRADTPHQWAPAESTWPHQATMVSPAESAWPHRAAMVSVDMGSLTCSAGTLEFFGRGSRGGLEGV
eukprot:1033740-Pyramimonas_sp.AAC.1